MRTTEQSQSYASAIVDTDGDAIIAIHLNGIVETWNPGAQNLFGYAPPEVMGRNIALLEASEQAGETSAILEKIARGEIVRHHRTIRLRKDGVRITVSIVFSPIRDDASNVIAASAIARDIGELAAIETALRQSEERYRSLALASAQIVWTKDAQGDAADDWPMWRAFTGQRADQIAGQGWRAAVHPEDRERISQVFDNAAASGAVYETEYRVRRQDGEYRQMAVRGVPIFAPGGRIREWVGSCADVTDRQRAEEEARQAQRELALQARFATIFLTLSEPEIFAAVLDAVLKHTQSQHGVFGYIDEEGALVIPIWTCEASHVPGEVIRLPRSEWAGVWGRALTEKRSFCSNDPAPSPGAGGLVQRVLAVPILFQTEPIGLFAIANKPSDYGEADRQTMERIARDIAPVFIARLQRDSQERARKRAEKALRTLNAELEKRVQERTAQLEAANHELEAFAYSVSHDLRAPLRAIHGFSQILMDEHASQLSGGAKHYLDVIHDNTLQMGKLIDALLIFSRFSRQPLQKQLVIPADLVAQALADLRAEIEPRIEIVVGELPPTQGDPILLKQVFVNLLSNAIKYSGSRPHAHIEVGARLPADGHAAVFYVRDNGVGFDMRHVHKLFGVFQRLHHARDYPGSGVGLATVQRIVHRHGGRVWAESEIDQGATFYFTIEPNK